MTTQELKAIEFALNYAGYYTEETEDIDFYIGIGVATINRGRNGKAYAWLMDEISEFMVDVETMQVITDEQFVEEQFL